ncbi:MAG: FG-GAP repeat protein [Gaiellaceae bacterium]
MNIRPRRGWRNGVVLALLAAAVLVPGGAGRAAGQGPRSTGDEFGISVAVSGDTALVGVWADDVGGRADQGAAYVFIRSAGVWTVQQKLTAADGAAGDLFGRSVAISGDTALVGAFGDDVGANANQGSAYVFTRTGGVWTEEQKLTAGDGAANDYLGGFFGVAISGDTAVVGASLDDVGATADQGSAYVFTRSAGVWSEQQQLTASDGASGDAFGWSVAISGDTALVGADGDDVGANSAQGSAYVFTRTGTVWSEEQQLTASDGAANDFFGTVAISGDTAVVGAFGDTVGANQFQGSAYVFTRSGGVWSEQQQLTAGDGSAGDFFGVSVAMDGETAIVGAYDAGAIAAQGAAYVFTPSGGVWSEQQRLTASDAAAFDEFGVSVGISGETAIVGAWKDDVDPYTNQGSAYVFTRSGVAWSEEQKLTASDPPPPTVPVVLHFHGSSSHADDPGCTGNGAADILTAGDDCVNLKPTATLGTGTAARFGPVDPALDGAQARNVYDPNWIWLPTAPTTLEGDMRIEFWASCGGCAAGVLNARWEIQLFTGRGAGLTPVVNKTVDVTPTTPNVPEKLTATVYVPNVTSDVYVLRIDPVFLGSQDNTSIYYDSSTPCPGAGVPDQCDSTVTLPVLATTSARMRSFDARASRGRVVLNWRTASETDLLGFNVWRRRGRGGGERKVNPTLVAARGDVAGTSYRIEDRSVRPGATYGYRLELVRANGSSWYGSARVTAR